MESMMGFLMGLNLVYNMMIGACLIPKLKSKRYVRYVAYSSALYSLFIVFYRINNFEIIKEAPYILIAFNSMFVLIMFVVNAYFFVKAMKNKFTGIINVINACLLLKGTKKERQKIQDESFDRL
jgi:hypothetical protein